MNAHCTDTASPTILDAISMWSSWHLDYSPFGSTGDFALDLRLADAFRALIYRQTTKERLDWLQKEIKRRPPDSYTHTLARWWLDIWEAEKAPVIEKRSIQRRIA